MDYMLIINVLFVIILIWTVYIFIINYCRLLVIIIQLVVSGCFLCQGSVKIPRPVTFNSMYLCSFFVRAEVHHPVDITTSRKPSVSAANIFLSRGLKPNPMECEACVLYTLYRWRPLMIGDTQAV